MKDNRISPQQRGSVASVTTLSNHRKSPSANRVQREFDRYTPNTVWLADITYSAPRLGYSEKAYVWNAI